MFTKGNWLIFEDNNGTFFIKNDQNQQVCEYIKTMDNANLLVASKDMYEILKVIQGDTYIYSFVINKFLPAIHGRIEETIAKIEGR